MPTLNQTFGARLERLGLRIPELLLPQPGVRLDRWSVVACDQYTSDQAYWDQVQAVVGDSPSALRLVLPEIYLERPDVPARVAKIHAHMQDYLQQEVLVSKGECLVYVRRTTAHSGTREGLLVAVDLERYDYSPGSKSLIRATEGTIVERIPPRLAVRSQAPLELPHIMVLLEDPERQLIEGLGTRCGEFENLYDVELMQGGGRLQGYRIDKPSDIEGLLSRMEALHERAKQNQQTAEPLLWAMGDGNHSLATAKANWEQVKRATNGQVTDHPARFALVELVNVYSPGLFFEPIHRAIFTSQTVEFAEALRADATVANLSPIGESALKALLAGPEGQDQAGYFDGKSFSVVHFKPTHELPPALVDGIFRRFAEKAKDARIDFIHGWDDTKKLAGSSAAVFFVPVLGRDRLFSHVGQNGPLPRKAFSMGHAEEKRYYMEARRITRG